jgi:cytochrome c556
MRKRIILFGVFVLLSVGAAYAAFEIDVDFMQKMEDTTKSLDSNVAQRNAKAATAEATEIVEMFTQVEAYYVQKGNADDAVGFAQKSRGFAVEVVKSVNANDFDAAATSVESLARSCKACHELYKKE